MTRIVLRASPGRLVDGQSVVRASHGRSRKPGARTRGSCEEGLASRADGRADHPPRRSSRARRRADVPTAATRNRISPRGSGGRELRVWCRRRKVAAPSVYSRTLTDAGEASIAAPPLDAVRRCPAGSVGRKTDRIKTSNRPTAPESRVLEVQTTIEMTSTKRTREQAR